MLTAADLGCVQQTLKAAAVHAPLDSLVNEVCMVYTATYLQCKWQYCQDDCADALLCMHLRQGVPGNGAGAS